MSRQITDEEYRVRRKSWHWARTAGGKAICPECGLTGWPGMTWTYKHAAHTVCECGKVVTLRGLGSHRASHSRRAGRRTG